MDCLSKHILWFAMKFIVDKNNQISIRSKKFIFLPWTIDLEKIQARLQDLWQVGLWHYMVIQHERIIVTLYLVLEYNRAVRFNSLKGQIIFNYISLTTYNALQRQFVDVLQNASKHGLPLCYPLTNLCRGKKVTFPFS